PASVSFAMSAGPGSQNWLTVIQVAHAAGADPRKLRIAVNSTGTETTTQLLGGHADIGVGGIDTSIPLFAAGKWRPRALATTPRVTGTRFDYIPTLREQGVNAYSSSWYAMVGPKGMPAEAVDYWNDVFSKAMNSDDGKRFVAESYSVGGVVGAKDFQAFLDE